MNTSAKTTINLAELIAPVISSRSVVSLVKDAVEKTETKSVELDFAKVEFISRSAAHELLIMKEDFLREDFKKEIAFINTTSSVSEMFRVVAANRAIPKTEDPVFHPKEISIDTLHQEARL